MTTLIKALTEQLQLWLGETASISEQDVAVMLQAASEASLTEIQHAVIRVEGHPNDVSSISVALKQILPIGDQKTQRFMLPNGNISRKLVIQQSPQMPDQGRPGNLSSPLKSSLQKRSSKDKTDASQDMLFDALATIAQGLLEYPTNEEGRRQFNNVPPPRFKQGISKLNAFFLSKGENISDPLEFWRLFSTPFKDWPHMPPGLQSPDPLIAHDGCVTALTKHLAKQAKDDL
ncbi:MAG: hypothetical protein AAF629_36570 [Chloroflexota bacterium]